MHSKAKALQLLKRLSAAVAILIGAGLVVLTVYGLVAPHPAGLPQSGVVHQKAIKPAVQETLNLSARVRTAQMGTPVSSISTTMTPA